MLYVSAWRHADHVMLVTGEIAAHSGPGARRQAGVAVHVLSLQPRVVESELAAGQAVQGPQLHGAVGVHVAQRSVRTVIGAGRTGVGAVPVVDPTVLEVRLELSYMVI